MSTYAEAQAQLPQSISPSKALQYQHRTIERESYLPLYNVQRLKDLSKQDTSKLHRNFHFKGLVKTRPSQSALSYRQYNCFLRTLIQTYFQDEPESAICVQNFDDSLNSAIHIKYRSSQRSSSMCEPRHPLLKVVFHFQNNHF